MVRIRRRSRAALTIGLAVLVPLCALSLIGVGILAATIAIDRYEGLVAGLCGAGAGTMMLVGMTARLAAARRSTPA